MISEMVSYLFLIQKRVLHRAKKWYDIRRKVLGGIKNGRTSKKNES